MSADPQTGAPDGAAYDWYVRGQALYEAGSAGAAAQLLTQALAAEPEARSIREALARALFDCGRHEQACTEFEILVQQAPDDHYAHLGAGLACWRLSRLSEAAEHLAIAVAMRPHRTDYRVARDQVRATIRARADAGLAIDGPIRGFPVDAPARLPAQGAVAVPQAGPPPALSEPDLPPVSDVSAAPERSSQAGPPPALSEPGQSLQSDRSEQLELSPGSDRSAKWADTPEALCRTHDVVLLDLDGVVYRGPQAIPRAVPSLRAAQAQGLRVAYVTNNASRTAAEVAEHLGGLGLAVGADDVVTSAQAGAALLRQQLPDAARVLAVGGPGVPAALTAVGLTVVLPRELDADHDPGEAGGAVAGVLMGYGPEVGWADLAEAAYAVGAGALFVATNTDLTLPTDRGVAPGNGTLVAAVVTATGRAPAVAGKPFSPLLEQSIRRTGATSPLVVGDRLDTDIEAATRLGLPSLLVLTGVSDVAALLGAAVQHRPTYLSADLRGLLARGRRIRASRVAEVDRSGVLHLADLDVPASTADPLGRLRAAAAACWAAADGGRPGTWSDHVLAALTADVDRALADG